MKCFLPNVSNGYTAHHRLDPNGAAILIKKWIPVQVINVHSANNVLGLETQLGLKKSIGFTQFTADHLLSLNQNVQLQHFMITFLKMDK